MISGPVMIQVLEGENAIARNRELMGATDPRKAEKGTIRADFAESIDANAVHGSMHLKRLSLKSPVSSRLWKYIHADNVHTLADLENRAQ